MQDKSLLFLMLQKIIQTKYDLDVIGLIQISPRVYKVKTANHFYCVKIVDEKKLEVAYQHLNTLHLHHFIHLILNNEQHYFTPFQDQYIYLMPYLQEDNHIKKEMKIFDEIIVANIQKESFTNKINCFLSKNKI